MRLYENDPELQRVACELAKHLDGISFNDLREKAGVLDIHAVVKDLNKQGFQIVIEGDIRDLVYKIKAGPGFVVSDARDLGAMVRNHYLHTAGGAL